MRSHVRLVRRVRFWLLGGAALASAAAGDEISLSRGTAATYLVVGVTHGNSFSSGGIARMPEVMAQPAAAQEGLQ
ncbi:hypothetical protein NicSoilB4_00620 [Arthrobacter sp. NicSoilB4]|nr:hypothetical protein NicSoilB4_00620 [Arthrobacter sp. NicSoilB4]